MTLGKPSRRKQSDTRSQALLKKGFFKVGDMVRYSKHNYTGVIIECSNVYVKIKWDDKSVSRALAHGGIIHSHVRASFLTKLVKMTVTTRTLDGEKEEKQEQGKEMTTAITKPSGKRSENGYKDVDSDESNSDGDEDD